MIDSICIPRVEANEIAHRLDEIDRQWGNTVDALTKHFLRDLARRLRSDDRFADAMLRARDE